jgi:hypothetical protein
VPVPFRIKLAASWPRPMRSWMLDAVRPLTSTRHISAACEEGIVRKTPRDSALMSYINQLKFIEE